MSLLSTDQKYLLFDHAMGLTSDVQADHAEILIQSNRQAADLYQTLRSSLAPLDTLETPHCPDALADKTVARLIAQAQESHGRLEQLLANEQARTAEPKRIGSWRSFGEMAAIAAAIMLIASVLIPSLNFARQKYWVQQCQKQMSSVFAGLSSYISDHDGREPRAVARPGSFWCRVGYQGQDNHSSTRPMWMLVKFDYVNPSDFVCPGRSDGRALQLNSAQIEKYCDFPAKRYITYSPRIHCTESSKKPLLGAEPILVDSNPIFDDVKPNTSRGFIRKLSDDLLKSNSRNHRGRGQNVLYGDGAAGFSKVRLLGAQQDDMFLLRNMAPGTKIKGDEMPECEQDFFFAP